MTNVTQAPRRSPARLGRAAALALTLLGMLSACDGDNLFTGNPTETSAGAPEIKDVIVPASAEEGRSLDITVRAVAPAGMASLHLRYRRAVELDPAPITSVANRKDQVTVMVPPLQMPAEAKDSILVIEAWVTDVAGRVSDVVRREVTVLDTSAPSVSAVVSPPEVGIGETISVRVTARDNAGLRQVGFVVVDAGGDTLTALSRLISVSGPNADTIFSVALPSNLQPASLRVVGLAFNNAQLRGVSAPLQLSVVDLLPPEVRIITPGAGDSYPLSDSILVRVHVADSAGVREVRLRGVAIRRDSLQNTTVVTRYAEKTITLPGLPGETAPRDTTLVRFLLPAGGDVSEDVHIIAEAFDLGGNMRADTVRISDGPRVQIMGLADNSTVGMNRTLLVHVNAVDRSAGLDSLKLVVGGIQQAVHTIRNLTPLQTVDTTFVVNIGAAPGQLTLQPRVWNRNEVGGVGQMIRLNVTSIEVNDTDRPRVLRTVTSAERVELTDTLRVVVRATDGDGSGIARMGMVAVITPDTDQLQPREVYRSSQVFTPPLSGTPERTFTFSIGEVFNELEMAFPRRFTVHVHAFAVDAAGNCGASVGLQFADAVCESVVAGGQTYYKATNLTPVSYQVTGAVGRSVRLPGGGRIADAIVDAGRQRVYLSNIENNKIDIFVLGADTFAVTNSQTGRGLVGAAPWGMVISNGNDSLYVANSGGTNISVLPLDGPTWMMEDVPRRIRMPNLVLMDITMEVVEGKLRYSRFDKDYSDRPQFIAQHSGGTLFFSTLPTAAAPDGTLRYVDMGVGPKPEIYLLNTGTVVPDPKGVALSHLDSAKVVRKNDNDFMVLFDRIPGTDQLVMSDTLALDAALEDIRDKGSDVEWFAGRWDHSKIALADTTYVASSADRNTIAFGEGAKSPNGRVFLCCGTPSQGTRFELSSQINVQDLVNNASERVFGVALNTNGSLGVARGSLSAYYFDRSLRLQGEFRNGMANGAGGAALHPNHGGVLQQDPIARLSFVPTSNRTIKIIDSVHFYERGEIHIRDNVVGPVRAFLPGAMDNAGVAPGHPNYIVVRLVAVTAGSHVVILNVRNRDISN